LRASERVQGHVDTWQWIGALSRDYIQLTVVHTETCGTVFLFDEHNECCPGTAGSLNDISVLHVLQELLTQGQGDTAATKEAVSP